MEVCRAEHPPIAACCATRNAAFGCAYSTLGWPAPTVRAGAEPTVPFRDLLLNKYAAIYKA